MADTCSTGPHFSRILRRNEMLLTMWAYVAQAFDIIKPNSCLCRIIHLLASHNFTLVVLIRTTDHCVRQPSTTTTIHDESDYRRDQRIKIVTFAFVVVAVRRCQCMCSSSAQAVIGRQNLHCPTSNARINCIILFVRSRSNALTRSLWSRFFYEILPVFGH